MSINWKEYNERKKFEKERIKELEEEFPDLGKIVYYDGEYGLVILDRHITIEQLIADNYDKSIEPICVRWDSNKDYDYEQYGFLNYKFIDNYNFKHIKKEDYITSFRVKSTTEA